MAVLNTTSTACTAVTTTGSFRVGPELVLTGTFQVTGGNKAVTGVFTEVHSRVVLEVSQ